MSGESADTKCDHLWICILQVYLHRSDILILHLCVYIYCCVFALVVLKLWGGGGWIPLRWDWPPWCYINPCAPLSGTTFNINPFHVFTFIKLYLTYQVRFADESINVLLRDNMEIQRLTPKSSFRILGYILLGCMSSRHMYILNEGNLLMRFLPPPPHASPM